MGYIYIIKNTLNDKVYIGQTIQSLKSRFKKHISDSQLIDFETLDYVYKHKLYNAFRKYGVSNFYIELVEECENSKLDEREIYYIKHFNSCKNGYNTTLGGDGYRIYSFTKEEESKIIDLYNIAKSIKEVSKQIGCSTRPIQEVLYRHNVEITDNSIIVVMYDTYFNPLKIFKSIDESRKFIEENTSYTSTDTRNYYRLLHKSFNEGNIAYGHRWQLYSDLLYDDKVFKTKFDKEAYINGGSAYQPDGKTYWIVNNSLENVIGKYTIANKNTKTSMIRCNICNKVITCYSKTGLCNSCANKNLKAFNKPRKPSKEELKALLNKGLKKKQIAQMYQRNASTVHSWIKIN